MITIIVGDINNHTTYELLTVSTNLKVNTYYYACLADFSDSNEFINKLLSADKIYYYPPNKWSNSKLEEETEKCLSFIEIYKNKNVDNFTCNLIDIEKMLDLSDSRKVETQQIWIAGCSFSQGLGVSTQERYGQLLSNKLNLPVSFLTKVGSSNTWAKDQILRSNIKKNDIVIWGLTSAIRMPYFHNGLLRHIFAGSFISDSEIKKFLSPDRLDEQTLIYDSITSIMQVINFCKLNSVNLYLLGIMFDASKYFTNIKNFIQVLKHGENIKNHYKDFGSDNKHSGPLTHAWYCDLIYNKIKEDKII